MISRRQALAELACFLCGGGAFVASVLLDVPRRYAIIGLVVALVGFVVWTRTRGIEQLADFGLRRDNIRVSAREVFPFTIVAAVLIVSFAWLRGVSFDRPELWILVPLYPLYGIAQQWVVQGVLHRRLRVLTSRGIAIALTGAGFGLLHVANPPLWGLTTCAGLAWAWLFARAPNVLTLGVSHGVLAALVYPLVIETNPLLSV